MLTTDTQEVLYMLFHELFETVLSISALSVLTVSLLAVKKFLRARF